MASQFGYNVSYYIGQAVSNVPTGPSSTVNALATYVWTRRPPRVTAVGQVLSGDFDSGAQHALHGLHRADPGIITPTVDAVTTVVNGVVQNALNVVAALPGIAADLLNTTVEVFQA